MIRLDIDNYCENCPEFESHVKKDTITYKDFNSCEPMSITNTIVTCEHRERCRSIKKFLEKETNND